MVREWKLNKIFGEIILIILFGALATQLSSFKYLFNKSVISTIKRLISLY